MASRIFAVTLALGGLIVTSGGAAAKSAQTVSFCFNNWAPYAVQEEAAVSGISFDVLRAAAERVGLSAHFQELPWNRCLEMVRQGRIDAVLDAAKRDEFLQGPTSYSEYNNTFWVRADSEITEFSFDALRGKRIGLIDGYKYPDALTRDIEAAQMVIDSSVDDATAIRKLAFSRVDVIIGDFVSTLLFSREHNLQIRALTPTHSADPLYPSFNPDRAELQRAIDSELAAMHADGAIDSIYEKYLGAAATSAGNR